MVRSRRERRREFLILSNKTRIGGIEEYVDRNKWRGQRSKGYLKIIINNIVYTSGKFEFDDMADLSTRRGEMLSLIREWEGEIDEI